MKKLNLSLLAMLFLGVTLLACAPRAEAQLDFNLTPAGLSGTPGSTLTFDATLFNAGSEAVYLNGIQDPAPLQLSVDSSAFFANTPPDLLSGESWSGAIFSVTIDPSADPGSSYIGAFTILGGADANAMDQVASQNFQVNVPASAAVPEPPFYQMAALLGLGGLALLRRRDRRQRAWRSWMWAGAA